VVAPEQRPGDDAQDQHGRRDRERDPEAAFIPCRRRAAVDAQFLQQVCGAVHVDGKYADKAAKFDGGKVKSPPCG
jgi:hypothetical protein